MAEIRKVDKYKKETHHPASHVTLLMSGGKFASGADFSGGRFLSFRGALIFFQGGPFSPMKNAQLNSGGLQPP